MILYLLMLILIAAGILSWTTGRKHPLLSRWIAAAAVVADLLIVLYFWIGEEVTLAGGYTGWIVEYRYTWIERFGIELHLALDGLGIVLLSLTYFLGLLSVLVSWSQINKRVGFFHFNVLLTLAGISGVFLSIDLFLFYFFWEMMLVPMYFIIGIWGHGKRIYASYKFFIFTQAGGLLMFAAILGLYFIHGAQTGTYTFDLTQLAGTGLTRSAAWLLMGGFLVGFAVKLPAVPFHSWLPDAHTEAPTAGSVLLAGLLLKTGAYGLLRIVVPVFPSTVHLFAPYGMILGVIGILYGAKLAFAQSDLKRLVAYSSISHMGFVMLGVFALNELAFQGVVMQMLAHGISTAALFIIAGMLQERTHTRSLDAYGGFWEKAPVMGGFTLVFALASLGLPGMAAFIGEFLTILGVYHSNVPIAVLASLGFIVSVIYSLRLFQRTFHGQVPSGQKIADLNIREILIVAPFVVLVFWFGLFPRTVFHVTEKPVRTLLNDRDRNEAGTTPVKGARSSGGARSSEYLRLSDDPRSSNNALPAGGARSVAPTGLKTEIPSDPL